MFSQKNYVEMITTILNHKNMKINYDHNNTKLRKNMIEIMVSHYFLQNLPIIIILILINYFFDYKIPSHRYNHDITNTLLKKYRKKKFCT